MATERDVDRAIHAAGLALREDRPYQGRILGRLYRGTVCVRRDIWGPLRRPVKAHELGHSLLGHGDGFYLRAADAHVASAELQAQVFAWTLLVGRPAPTYAGLDAQLHQAVEAGLPLDFCFTAVSILATRLPAVRGTPLLELA